MSVQEIKEAVASLSAEEIEELLRWMEQEHPHRHSQGFGKFSHLPLSSRDVTLERRAEVRAESNR